MLFVFRSLAGCTECTPTPQSAHAGVCLSLGPGCLEEDSGAGFGTRVQAGGSYCQVYPAPSGTAISPSRAHWPVLPSSAGTGKHPCTACPDQVHPAPVGGQHSLPTQVLVCLHEGSPDKQRRRGLAPPPQHKSQSGQPALLSPGYPPVSRGQACQCAGDKSKQTNYADMLHNLSLNYLR